MNCPRREKAPTSTFSVFSTGLHSRLKAGHRHRTACRRPSVVKMGIMEGRVKHDCIQGISLALAMLPNPLRSPIFCA